MKNKQWLKFHDCIDELNKFEKIEHKFNKNPKTHAIILLSKIFFDLDFEPSGGKSLNILLFSITSNMCEHLKNSEVLDLVRCGVYYSVGYNKLIMKI